MSLYLYNTMNKLKRYNCNYIILLVLVLISNLQNQFVSAFQFTKNTNIYAARRATVVFNSNQHNQNNNFDDNNGSSYNDNNKIVNHYTATRRDIFKNIKAASAASLVYAMNSNIANAEETITLTKEDKMTLYNDPNGLFRLSIPKSYFIFRRPGNPNNKGKTKSRKGSAIFTAGDIGKAEIVSIDRFTTISFLEEEGGIRIADKAIADLSTFSSIGKAETIAKYIILRRNREQQQTNTNVVAKPENIKQSNDGKTLSFEYSTKINVQKPELLMEQIGVDELYRITLVRIDLHSNDGFMNVCYASALQTEFYGDDGILLRDSIDSFEVFELQS